MLRCGDRRLDLSLPRVMGVLNVTPDSFSDGGRFLAHGQLDVERAVACAVAMVEAGADLIDIGGESTRPGALGATEREEIERVIPIVERLAGLDTIISVDTSKANVAREALRHGASMINDVRALADPALLSTVASSGAAVCLMHMQGEPRTMQAAPHYGDVVTEVSAFLGAAADRCRTAGVDADRIVVDPGFGFGKTFQHNLDLFRALPRLSQLGYPVLVGVSRKRMIGDMTGRDVEHRVAGSVAAAMLAVARGARIVRVHDVAETVDALRVQRTIGDSEGSGHG